MILPICANCSLLVKYKRLLGAFLLIVPFVLQRLLVARSSWIEQVYVRQIFPILVWPWRTLTGLLPFSLTELLVILAPILLVCIVVVLLLARRNVVYKPMWTGLRRSLAALLIIASWAFMLHHGFNYLREPVAQSFKLPVQARTVTELENLGVWVVEQATTARAACEEDEQGVFQIRNTLAVTLPQALEGYHVAAARYPLLAGAAARPKSVMLSPLWSYTQITGLYMPLWVEANINTDQPDYLLPATVNHELAHTIGFAREDEAGFIGFLAGTSSPYADYRYSSYAEALIHVLNSLMATDQAAYQRITQRVPPAIWRDIADANDYWQQFAGPVATTSTQVNNAYLKANLQPDGVHSYGRMVDLLLAWYQENNLQKTLPEALP
ncbi:MAG: DUF3810 domain-containing protein [Eubacteriales bacterium]|nr:DUF3810 domain-containing protein [Eubacteriales bacterium]